jgi:hypothetical protein
LAVNVDEVAWPLEPVVAVVVAVLVFVKVPDAPLDGAVKVTEVPDTRLPFVSVTVATSGFANAAPTLADWGEPKVTAIVVAVPAVMLKLLALLGAVNDPLLDAVRV